ncbi:sushi, von Willebrand factor type A, EGF and pentraxin domain-containing protein 1-like [Styela clava]
MNSLLVCFSATIAVISATGSQCQPPLLGKYQVLDPELPFYVTYYKVHDIITITCSKLYLYDSVDGSFVRGNKLTAKCAGRDKFKPEIPAGKYVCKEREASCQLKLSPNLVADPDRKIFTRGESVTFTCDGANYLSGVRRVKCGRDGAWSDRIPFCLPLCKKPKQPYLIVTDDDDSYSGGSINLSCEPKYRLMGEYKRYCEANGKFDPPIEDNLCMRTGCKPPPKFKNGKYTPGPGYDNWYEESDEIKYECDEYYYLDGKYKRTCSRSGKFIFGEPKCIEIRCDKPMEIDNGDFSPVRDDYAVTDSVTYECKVNYRLSTKSGKRTCVQKTTKTAEFETEPSCIRIECDKPKEIKYGSFGKKKNYYVGTTVEYTCDDGFYLKGESEIECLLNKDKLTADFEKEPECRPILCDKPMAPAKGSFSPEKSTYRLEESIKFMCMKNYYLDGPTRATCVEDTRTKGKFTKFPKCIEVRCDKPMVPNKGSIDPSEDDYPVGADITYSCDTNYKLMPEDGGRTCTLLSDMKSASFGPGAICERIECDDPMNIENGDFDPSPKGPFTVGYVVNYKCKRGYKFSTKFTDSTCTLNKDKRSADFSKRPICERVYCDNPGKPDNGDITENKKQYVVDETVTWSCKPCYQLVGTVTATCQQNGEFDKSKPTCVLRTCSKKGIYVPLYADFSVKKNKYTCGEKITYTCHEDYNLNGDDYAECLPSGKFSKISTTCDLITCARPMLNPKVRVSPDKESYAVKSEITYSCKGNYKASTDKLTAVCQHNGKFSRPSPYCELITCGKPPIPENGAVIDYNPLKLKYQVYEGIEYICNQYYSLKGGDTNVCEENGSWKNSAPTCKPPVCKHNCHMGQVYGRPCQCDSGCVKRKDCCDDYKKTCQHISCKDRCGQMNYGYCSCKQDCLENRTCCKDYLRQCPGEWYL